MEVYVICADCSEPVEDTGEYDACQKCGLILASANTHFDEGALSANNTYVDKDNGGTQYIPLVNNKHTAYQRRCLNSVRTYIRALTHKLNLKGYDERILHYYNIVKDRGSFPFGRHSELLAVTCAYIIIRQEGKAWSLGQIASAVNCDKFQLGKFYSRAKELLAIQLDLPDAKRLLHSQLLQINKAVEQAGSDRLLYNMEGQQTTLPHIFTSIQQLLTNEYRQLHKLGYKIWKFSDDKGLNTGKHITASTTACILISIETKLNNKLTIKNKEELTKIMNDDNHCATVYHHYLQMRKLLCAYIQYLPWASNLKQHNFYRFVNDLFEYPNLISSASKHKHKHNSIQSSLSEPSLLNKSDFNIPSFASNYKARKINRLAIIETKKYLKSLIMPQPTNPQKPHITDLTYDITSKRKKKGKYDFHRLLLIQKLILRGVKTSVLECLSTDSMQALVDELDRRILASFDTTNLDCDDVSKYIRTDEEVDHILTLQNQIGISLSTTT